MSMFYTTKSDSKVSTPIINNEFVDNREDLHDVITDIFDEAMRYRYRESVVTITDSDQLKDVDMSKQHTLIFKGNDSVKDFNNTVGKLRTKSVIIFLEIPSFTAPLFIKADIVMFIGCGKITPSAQRITAKHLLVMDTEEFSLMDLDIYKHVVLITGKAHSPYGDEVEEDWYVFSGDSEVVPAGSKRFNRTAKTDSGTRYMINPKMISTKISELLNIDLNDEQETKDIEQLENEIEELDTDIYIDSHRLGFAWIGSDIVSQHEIIKDQYEASLKLEKKKEALRKLKEEKESSTLSDEWVYIWDILEDPAPASNQSSSAATTATEEERIKKMAMKMAVEMAATMMAQQKAVQQTPPANTITVTGPDGSPMSIPVSDTFIPDPINNPVDIDTQPTNQVSTGTPKTINKHKS